MKIFKLRQKFNANDFTPDLLTTLLLTFDETKTIQEVACDICKIVLSGVNKRLKNDQLDYCALLGYFDWLNILKLKGAAGFQPYGFNYNEIPIGKGLIGRVAKFKKMKIVSDLNEEKSTGEFERYFSQLSDKVALAAFPLLLNNEKLVAVLVLGKALNQKGTSKLFKNANFQKNFAQLTPHIATIYHHAILVTKSKLAKRYVDHERHLLSVAKEFYSDSKLYMNPEKYMEVAAKESLKLLNSGNPKKPYYTNYLFYEFQEYGKRFVLRCFKKPKYQFKSININQEVYKMFIEDQCVKCVESQVKYVKNRGKQPFVIRYVPNKVEQIIEHLDANWSPAGFGNAFIVPLFNDNTPLGILVFFSPVQNRKYVNQTLFYLGPEKRKSSHFHLKYFRSLQPIIAREYLKLKLENRQGILSKLENMMSALKDFILLEDRSETLDRLAKFATKSLNCEGCIIYIKSPDSQTLSYAASFGFKAIADSKTIISDFLKDCRHKNCLPHYIFHSREQIITNSSEQFRRLAKRHPHCTPLLKKLKSKKVMSYLGQRIGKIGVIEVYNSSKQTPYGWSFFEEQDTITLNHICEVIMTVIQKMETTESQVQTEKARATSELLLDISHELKNPLYSSRIFIRKLKHLLDGESKNFDRNQVKRMMDLIESNTEKAQNILRSMQSFQKFDPEMKLKQVNLCDIIQMVVHTNQTFCDQQNIKVQMDLQASDAFVKGDGLLLNQAFTNLITNAIDAMPNGGVLSIRTREADSAIITEVEDTGHGIPDEIKGRVFEAFVTTKKLQGGIGLGLTLTQQIIAKHHGNIQLAQKENKDQGTKFIVFLPRYSA